MIHRYRKKIKLKLRKNNCLFSYYLVPLVKGLLFRIGKVKLQRESNPEVKAVKSERERGRKREEYYKLTWRTKRGLLARPCVILRRTLPVRIKRPILSTAAAAALHICQLPSMRGTGNVFLPLTFKGLVKNR